MKGYEDSGLCTILYYIVLYCIYCLVSVGGGLVLCPEGVKGV